MTDLDLKTIAGSEDPLSLKLRGGGVKRYHMEGGMVAQLVSDHTWRLLIILLHLWPEISREAMFYAIYHDVPEGLTGDAPAPVKRMPGVREAYLELERRYEDFLGLPRALDLTFADRARVKVADYIELCMTCIKQSSPEAKRIFSTGKRYVHEACSALSVAEAKAVRDLMNDIETGAIYG